MIKQVPSRLARRGQWIVALTVLVFFAHPVVAQAEKPVASVDKLIGKGQQLQQQAVASQQRINDLSEEARALFERFQLESKRLEDLNIYNAQLENQLERQEAKIREINETLQNISVMERQMAPLLLRMIHGLEQFIQLDLPFLPEERQTRVTRLKDMMNRADVTIAEKFRQVFDAYSIELEYGNTIEAYRGTLPGTQRDVEFLRIGRIGLLYQTLDGKDIGAWDRDTRQWVEVPNRFRRDIRKGLKMAKKQISPDIIKIPLNAADAREGAL
ncbi:MAG: DUF3450 domain-containing protein [Ketobacteraceae bacterium]|nr:DUF3450 domain-containing protein [Ketobacteraceae bacterium]